MTTAIIILCGVTAIFSLVMTVATNKMYWGTIAIFTLIISMHLMHPFMQ